MMRLPLLFVVGILAGDSLLSTRMVHRWDCSMDQDPRACPTVTYDVVDTGPVIRVPVMAPCAPQRDA